MLDNPFLFISTFISTKTQFVKELIMKILIAKQKNT